MERREDPADVAVVGTSAVAADVGALDGVIGSVPTTAKGNASSAVCEDAAKCSLTLRGASKAPPDVSWDARYRVWPCLPSMQRQFDEPALCRMTSETATFSSKAARRRR